MNNLEDKIKDFVQSQGVKLIGIAGPERLNGPPSLDVTYTMKNGKSIVSMALPMDVNAIYDFLSKKSQINHNTDQLINNQKLHHISARVAGFLKSLGHKAAPVPSNNTYRRSPDPVATHPSFSHRFGAIASGIAAQGLSGNVMTKEYGAAIYLGTVVTNAILKSDPMLPPGYFIDNFCEKCMKCDKACPVRMFKSEEKESILLNGELHQRGKRRSIDLCNASCFGLHSLSVDKTWSSWGSHWISKWTEKEPDPENESIKLPLLIKGGAVGDSAVRYELIRRLASKLYPEEILAPDKLGKKEEDYPDDELERRSLQARNIKKYLGVKVYDANVLTCGHCAMVCGPDIKETAKRLKMLREGGIVVQGKDRRTVITKSFEEAKRIKKQYPIKVSLLNKFIDMNKATAIFLGRYWGIEPKSIIQNWIYQRNLKRAIKEMGNKL